MLTDDETGTSQLLEPEPAPPPVKPSPGRGRGLRAQRTLAFGGALAIVLVYALRGGSYDVVVFQEHGLVVWWVLAIGQVGGEQVIFDGLLATGDNLLHAIQAGRIGGGIGDRPRGGPPPDARAGPLLAPCSRSPHGTLLPAAASEAPRPAHL